MRCAVVLLALAAFGAAKPQLPKQHAADQTLLKKQQDCLYLLQQITHEIPNEQLHILGTTYEIQNNYHKYENPILVKYYVGAVKAGLVQPKHTVYSNSINQLRKEVSLLHRVLIGAKDYQTFLSTAAWARVHVNEDQFVKAFIGAVFKHPETQGITLPPLYEVIPQYYFDARIIQQVQDIYGYNVVHEIEKDHVVVPVNYTAYLPDGEHQLSYFTQDIGLANYYAFVNLAGYLLNHKQHQTPVHYSQGLSNQEIHNGQGSRYYYLHQQLLAHYELNRLGNGLGPIHHTDYNHVNAPFQPHLRYANGLEFPGRQEDLHLVPSKHHLVQYVKTLEKRLLEAIDSGHVITPQGVFLSLYQPQGLTILGDLIEGTGRSVNPRYYGGLQAVARQLLGNAPEFQNIYDYTPSVLELGQVAVRDPAFYQLYKKIIHLFQHYQNSLPAYQYNDIVVPGVNIQKVECSQLVTFFNDYYVDVDGGTVHHTVKKEGTQQHIKAQVKRLDHKPYEYTITVQSENHVPGSVFHVYLGPKYNYEGKPICISEYRHHFVEFDQFIVDLQQGENVINRHSHQAPTYSHDYPSIEEIKQRVHAAVNSEEPFYVTEPHHIYGFPARLSLPKGHHTGLPLQLLVVVSQPGHYNVPYGPVISDYHQTYEKNTYEVIGTEEYPQYVQHQNSKTGVKQTIEVVPEDLPIGQQEDQVVKHYYSHLYTKQHGQYPYTHSHYQIGQGKNVEEPEHQFHQGIHHGTHQGQYHHEVPVHSGATTGHGVPVVQGEEGVVPELGVPVHGGVQTGVPTVSGKYHTTYQGQSQKAQGQGIEYYGSGQYHAGGYQNIQGQNVQDGYLSDYYQTKEINEIIGGAVSLDGKPYGYPLDRPLTPGALYVPNLYVQTVHVYHEGQPTNEMYHQ